MEEEGAMMNMNADDFFMEKVPGFHSEACEWPLGGLWDKFLALWSSGLLHVEELLI
jgi:hypothetical protein